MKKEQRAVYLVTIEEEVAFYLLTYGFNMERMYIYICIYIYIYKRSIRSINSLKLIKRV